MLITIAKILNVEHICYVGFNTNSSVGFNTLLYNNL